MALHTQRSEAGIALRRGRRTLAALAALVFVALAVGVWYFDARGWPYLATVSALFAVAAARAAWRGRGNVYYP